MIVHIKVFNVSFPYWYWAHARFDTWLVQERPIYRCVFVAGYSEGTATILGIKVLA
ncbi:hypothetical protein O9929_16080 [Vibrio lentus]|nr:hypothetical protein [Vibrio lentus]